MFQQALKKPSLNPKNLFLIDCIGALLSATFYGVILMKLEAFFGIPLKPISFLSLLACIYAVYSGTCYLLNFQNPKPYLKIIAIANLIHCCFTIGIMFAYYQKLTILGLLYFVVELIIVISLIFIELKTASGIMEDKN